MDPGHPQRNSRKVSTEPMEAAGRFPTAKPRQFGVASKFREMSSPKWLAGTRKPQSSEVATVTRQLRWIGCRFEQEPQRLKWWQGHEHNNNHQHNRNHNHNHNRNHNRTHSDPRWTVSAQLVTDAVSVDLGERSLRAVATKVMSGSTPHFGPVYTRVKSTLEPSLVNFTPSSRVYQFH